MERTRRFHGGILALGLSLTAVLGVALPTLRKSAPRLCESLLEHGVAALYDVGGDAPHCDGLVYEPAPDALLRALDATPPEPLVAELARTKIHALAIEASQRAATGVGAALAERRAVPGLAAAVLAPDLTVVVARDLPALTSRERDAVAHVARAILLGAREPQLASFPASLKRFVRAEVMVALKDRGRPVLWRSARATSLARALLTATRVARDRFRERENALGGPLAERMLTLDVDVSVLVDEGDLTDHSRVFIDAAVGPGFGVGYDHRGAWHYVLPDELARRQKAGEPAASPYDALLALLAENGSGPDALGAEDMRIYRFREVLLGSSRSPLSASPEPTDEPPVPTTPATSAAPAP
jgi:hypothetical protein